MLLILLIYSIWPPAPGARQPIVVTQGGRTTDSDAGNMQLRVESSAGPERSFQEPGDTALSEIPSGRATVHWIEYLEFRGQRARDREAGKR
jgi:hypothetical protein